MNNDAGQYNDSFQDSDKRKIKTGIKVLYVVVFVVALLAVGFYRLNVRLYKKSPLYLASMRGDLDKVKKLLDEGADVNAKTLMKRTPLHGAATGGSPEITLLLCKKGADVNAIELDDNATPLDYALLNNHYRAAKILVEYGGKTNRFTEEINLEKQSREEVLEYIDRVIKEGNK